MKPALALAIVVVSSMMGCSSVTVTRVDPDNPAAAKGLQYCLPKPVIQATPKPDGTVSFDVVYVPDEENTYAIDASGWMDNRTVEIQVDENRLLKKVAYNANTTVVASKLAEFGGTLAKSSMTEARTRREAELKARADAQAARDKEVTALEAEIKTARTTLLTAQLTETNARIDRDDAKKASEAKQGDAGLKQTLAEKEVLLLKAEADRKQKEGIVKDLGKQLETLKASPLVIPPIVPGGTETGTGTGGTTANTADVIIPATGGSNKIISTAPAVPKVPGPIFYAVVEGVRENVKVVELHALGTGPFKNVPRVFESITINTGPPNDQDHRITADAVKDKIGPAESLVVNVKGEFTEVNQQLSALVPDVGISSGMEIASLTRNGQTVTVSFKTVKPGGYTLKLVLMAKTGSVKKAATANVHFEITQ